MLDTDTCIFYSRKTSPSATARVHRRSPGDLVISAVTYGELRFGAEKSANPVIALQMLDTFTQVVPALHLDPQVGEHYGRIRLHLQRKGRIIGNNDLWIASHCLQLGLTLVTNNEREFSRIPNLTIENWTH
ncbi:MAG TPA: type II toxin-antitoxin system VapC family toxin [Acidobacteriaceae bacterium]|nr:type II toxin-antitoxin system VapC family toxin [Acidobacteriaceae bacterium]